MARGPIVTGDIEALIARIQQQHPKWKAPTIRNEVRRILQERQPSLATFHPNWPTLSTVQKVLAKVRRKANELPLDPQAKPWSLGTLDDYPIDPAAIAPVLDVWKYRIEKGADFSIREARWAARLAAVKSDIAELSAKATQYAQTELMYMLVDRPFDSTNLDRLLMGLPVHLTDDIASAFPLLALQSDGVKQVKSLTRGKRKKLDVKPYGQNAIPGDAPIIGPGLAKRLSHSKYRTQNGGKS
ncbi:MAG: hypothetical protein SVP26_11050 [Chloroflexota bacterium]|nr:hypothetical protein [Chloroflexota bacterium]